MTLGSHQCSVGANQNWITPAWIIQALGPFSLDPCANDPQPWSCADENWTVNGLARPWHGRVWLNPPFNRYEVGAWISRLAKHGHGTALLHARTEAEWFEPCWQHASAMLFLADRIYFHHPDGSRAAANSGAPAVLISFGAADADRLRASGIQGFLVTAWEQQRGRAMP